MGTDTNRRRGNRKPGTGASDAPRVRFGAIKDDRALPSFDKVEGFAKAIDQICKAGDALVLSSTSDGGALVVTVLSGDSREKAYAPSQAALDATFELIRDAYDEG